MPPRISNVVPRGSLVGVRRDGFLPDCCAHSPAGWEKPTTSHHRLSRCARGSKIPDTKIYDIPVVFLIRILSTEVKQRRLVFRNMADGHGWTFLSNHAHLLI